MNNNDSWNSWNSWHDCVDDSYDNNNYSFDECGFISGWGCTAVGSQECEFECPYHKKFYSELNRIQEISEQN